MFPLPMPLYAYLCTAMFKVLMSLLERVRWTYNCPLWYKGIGPPLAEMVVDLLFVPNYFKGLTHHF